MGNTFQRFRKAEPTVSTDVSGSILSFDMSGIEFVSTEAPHIDVSGVQVTMEPIETPHTIVTVLPILPIVPIVPMLDAPLSVTPLFETQLVPPCEYTHRGAIFEALLTEIYGAIITGHESRSKDLEEVNLCSYICRRLLQLVNPAELTAKTEELDSEPSGKTNGNVNLVHYNVLDAANQAGKCKNV